MSIFIQQGADWFSSDREYLLPARDLAIELSLELPTKLSRIISCYMEVLVNLPHALSKMKHRDEKFEEMRRLLRLQV